MTGDDSLTRDDDHLMSDGSLEEEGGPPELSQPCNAGSISALTRCAAGSAPTVPNHAARRGKERSTCAEEARAPHRVHGHDEMDPKPTGTRAACADRAWRSNMKRMRVLSSTRYAHACAQFGMPCSHCMHVRALTRVHAPAPAIQRHAAEGSGRRGKWDTWRGPLQ